MSLQTPHKHTWRRRDDKSHWASVRTNALAQKRSLSINIWFKCWREMGGSDGRNPSIQLILKNSPHESKRTDPSLMRNYSHNTSCSNETLSYRPVQDFTFITTWAAQYIEINGISYTAYSLMARFNNQKILYLYRCVSFW